MAESIWDTPYARSPLKICLTIFFAIVFIACSAVAFASSIWVIYMALYVGFKAQFSALRRVLGAISVSFGEHGLPQSLAFAEAAPREPAPMDWRAAVY